MTPQELAVYLRAQGFAEEAVARAVAEKIGNDRLLERRRQIADHQRAVDAYWSRMVEIIADDEFDFEEMKEVCAMAPQWIAQLTAARDFVAGFREEYPQVSESDMVLDRLGLEAEKGLTAALAMEEAGEESCRLLLLLPSTRPTPAPAESSGGAEEEAYRQALADPCFRGRVPSRTGTGWTYLWDTECQLHSGTE